LLLINEIGTWDLTFDEGGKPAENNIYNQLFRKTLGYQDEKDFPNVFESWLNTIAPDKVEKVTSVFQDHYSTKTKKPYDIEFKSMKKNGSIEWFHAKAETLRGENGQPYRNIGTIVNIHRNKVNTIRIQNLLLRLELIEKALGYSVTTLEGYGEWI
jgi:PAS fold